ncbi:succinate dehydrogenase, hydrophobic membrane anchor protein [Coxiella endosymbiont of Amblyomma americanum]|uniref:succinate dehydrogenase, hydrophobic membrane anchor protein n=1 Tax=Coxiella endosymbiont of Amblyomma americanum TaxID=325775 RepID=UPI00057E2890|nr:succinate dehydrogenase, hydrophobic membrane anchor protein [Coxiella endosymbiont of Amblyomma americanum]
MVNQKSYRGYRNWCVQRITACLGGIYTVFVIIFLVTHHPISYAEWNNLFTHTTMKIFTLSVVLSMLWHAWIGVWTIITDYVKDKPIQLILEAAVCLLLVICFIMCISKFFK